MLQVHARAIARLSERYPHSISVVENGNVGAAHGYNCFMYALGVRQLPAPLVQVAERVEEAFPGSAFVVELLEGRYLREVDEADAHVGSVVIYFENGLPEHAGIVGEDGFVVSKWGKGHLYRHSGGSKCLRSTGMSCDSSSHLNPTRFFAACEPNRSSNEVPLFEPLHLSLALGLGFGLLLDVPRVQLRRRFPVHLLVHDRVAPIDGFRFVADHRHRRRARHAGAFERAHGGASEIVKQLARMSGRLARRLPRRAEVLDAVSRPVDETRRGRSCGNNLF